MTEHDGIRVIDVSRRFGEVHAVRSATMEAVPGHVTALIGPNGSGKTTLMLMLASLLRPDAGSIRVAGYDPVENPAQVRANLGWMPDLLGSWASLTTRETLVFTGRLYQLDVAAARDRAEELMGLVGLDALADQPTRVLSRGQKQRLSLARALVHDPNVLLLDEPASGLDPAARVDLRTLVRRLASEGKTILISSHVLAELDEMADAAVYLDSGTTATVEQIARTAGSLRQWRIRSLDDRVLAEKLTEIGIPADRVTVDALGTQVALTSESDAAAFLAALVGRGVPVTSFSPAVGNLEHTFLDLRRADQEHGASS